MFYDWFINIVTTVTDYYYALLSSSWSLSVSVESGETVMRQPSPEPGPGERLETVVETNPGLVNLPDEDGLTPLHLAALSGNLRALEVFLSSRGVSVDQPDTGGHSALHWAAVCQRADCVSLLHQHGAQINLPDQTGAGALHYAVQTDQPDLVSVLLDLGADINLRDGLGRSPTMWAASCDSLAPLDLLLAAGPDLEARDDQSLTALHTGAARGNVRSLEALLDHQPGLLDLPDSDGAPALFYAASQGRLDCVKLLTERKAAVRLRDRLGRTALTSSLTSSSTEVLQVCQVLLAAGADLAVTTEEGDSVLHLAVSRRLVETVVWILNSAPALINKQNRAGLTPLHLASSLNHIREVSSCRCPIVLIVTNIVSESARFCWIFIATAIP